MATVASTARLRIEPHDGSIPPLAWEVDDLELVWSNAWDDRADAMQWDLTGVLRDVRGADRTVGLHVYGPCRAATPPCRPSDFPAEMTAFGSLSDEPISESLPCGSEERFFEFLPSRDSGRMTARPRGDGLEIELRLTGNFTRHGDDRRAEVTVTGTARVRILADASRRLEVWPGRSGWPRVRDDLARYRAAFFSDLCERATRADPHCGDPWILPASYIALTESLDHPLLCDLATAYFVLCRAEWLHARGASDRTLSVELRWRRTVAALLAASHENGTLFEPITPREAHERCAWIRKNLEASCLRLGASLEWPAYGTVREAFAAVDVWNWKALVLRTDAGLSLLTWATDA